MKKETASRAGQVVLVVLLFAAQAAQAGTGTYHLSIPIPPPPPAGVPPITPVSKVRLRLITDASPVSGTVAIRLGTNTISSLAVPAIGHTVSSSSTPQPGIDRLSVTAFDRAIVIDFEPNSMLDEHRCHPASSATGREYLLDWSGGFGVTGSRSTSYYGLNTGTASSPDCSRCQARAEGFHASIWSEPFSTNFGRNPMDVVLVLDKSGSMSEQPDGRMQKWEALRRSVKMFIASWKVELGPTESPGPVEDRLGVVLFDDVAQIRSVPPFFVPRGADGSSWNALKDYVLMQVPGGATAMGDGLATAYHQRDIDRRDDPNPDTALLRDTAFLLVTDALQNRPPYVNGLETGEPLNLEVEGVTKVLKDECVPIHTVSVDTPTDSVADRLLNAISFQTAGQYAKTVPPSLPDDDPPNIHDPFITLLKSALGGYSEASTLTGLVSPSTPPVAPARGASPTVADTVVNTLDVELDSSIRSALVILQWYPSAPVDLRVRSPHRVIQPSARSSDDGEVVARIDLPEAGPAGTWSFDVMAGAVSTQTSYHLTVLANETRLGMKTRVAGARHFTGQPLTISTFVALDSVPVEGRAKLEATLTRPATALGTILHDAQIPNPVPDTSGDPRSPYEAKVRVVLADPVLREKVLKKEKKEKLKFKHASSGSYVLTVDSLDVPGTYRFDIALEIPMPGGERIRRIDSIETVVEASPTDPNVRVKPLGGGRYQVQVVPRDAFGQYAGPGRNLVATTSRGKVAGVVDPQIRGEYVVELVNVTGNPTLTLTLDGTPLGSKPLSQWDSSRPQVLWDNKVQLRRAKMPIQRPGQRRSRLLYQ